MRAGGNSEGSSSLYKILKKRSLNPTVTEMIIHAPLVARKAKAGQFIILRVDEEGERIPLTIAGSDPASGGVRIIFQIVGATTFKLNEKKEGESIADFAGPLGEPTDIEGLKKVIVVGGGVGSAIALPVTKALKAQGTEVVSIIGFRSKDLLILEDEFAEISDRLIVATDDGSYGLHGNVTLPLKELLEKESFDRIITIGPLIMMKFVVATARPFNVPVTVSMNSIMIDGTGMCGCCRLTLNTEEGRVVRFACVDGPDFDGYQVDFDEAMSRGRSYMDFERRAYEETCNLFRKEA